MAERNTKPTSAATSSTAGRGVPTATASSLAHGEPSPPSRPPPGGLGGSAAPHNNVALSQLPLQSGSASQALTGWLTHDFSATQIFREIIFGQYKVPNTAIFTVLDRLNFYLVNFCHEKVVKFIFRK